MKTYESIGCTPYDEPCAQVGSEGYAERARAECQRFMKQIAKHYPEPENGRLVVKIQRGHDFGAYYEVIAKYDDEDAESTAWAYDIEGDTKNVLANWEV